MHGSRNKVSTKHLSADIAVVGGGPAGYTAAIYAARRGLKVLIIDKARKKLMKLRITGKGRCNLTNDCSDQEFFDNVLRNPRFLRSSESSFGPKDIMSFFQDELGVPLKVERGNRVFPVSDRAGDIADALIGEAERLGVDVIGAKAEKIRIEDGAACGVSAGEYDIEARAVLIATGGLSYPVTGSDGDGYVMAESAGHRIRECSPSLVGLRCSDEWMYLVEGLSLKNVSLTAKCGKKTVFSDQGEMLFTGDGVSGPLVLSLSAVLAGKNYSDYRASIDMKPALDEETLDRRVLRDFAEFRNREFRNSLDALLPRSMIPAVVTLSGIDPGKQVNEITASERRNLVSLIKHIPLNISGNGGWNEAVVTAGGIDTREINPGTMESKLVRNLYFAGEVIDTDAYTGGYNLTIAFCTGHAAGVSMLRED